MSHPERSNFSAKLRADRLAQLKQISEHHKTNGEDHMSMTKVIEQLVAKEHKRLKL